MSLLKTVATKLFRHGTKMAIPQRLGIHYSHVIHESNEDLVNRYEAFFARTDIDGWDIRQAMNDISGMDLIPDPCVIISAMYACRRVNDYALAVRFLEVTKNKCGPYVDKYYPYILQEIAPTLCELGIDTPEALGYDEPELFLLPAQE